MMAYRPMISQSESPRELPTGNGHHPRFNILVCALSFLFPCIISAQPVPSASANIRKISFLIHPVCWDLALGRDGRPAHSYLSTIESMRGGAFYDQREFLEILA